MSPKGAERWRRTLAAFPCLCAEGQTNRRRELGRISVIPAVPITHGEVVSPVAV